jgi:tape measure domain-containing protein
MAEYNINFSTNAEKAAQEISRVSKELTAVIQVGKSIKLNLDTSSLSRSINVSFRTLNKEIDKIQTRLSKLQIGSGAFRSTAAALGYREGQRERGEMIAQPLRLRGQAQSFERGSNVRLQKELRALQIEASQIAPNTIEWVRFQQEIAKVNLQLQRADKLADDIQLRENLGAFAPNSLAAMDAKLTILRNKAREIAPNDKQWKQVNKEIQQLERGIAKVSKKPLSAGQRAGAAGGAFLYGGGMGGGVGSAVGGIAGGLMGGVPGAFAGAAIGQVADNLGTALAGITSQAAAVQKMQRGLAMASVDAKDFAEAQAAVGEMSQKLLMPLEQTTKYFAQLRANTKEYNLSVADTKEILEGTALAIMATGGSAEDLDGAMRAVVQIMSKGGVQAEELRGQLGERFPGAVVKFAQANKMSFEKLQAGLEAGTIGIREFINFAKKNYTDYAKFSEQLATAPEYAGQRMKMALEQISLEVGSLFGPMGADIQDGFTQALKGVAEFVKANRTVLKQMIQDFGSIVVPIVKVFGELLKVLGAFAFEVAKVFTSLFQTIKNAIGMASIGTAKARLDKAKAATAGKTRSTPARGDSVVAVLTGQTVLRDVKDLLGVQNEFEELDAAQKQFNDLGGMAAYNQASQPVGPSNLTFGGAGAGMSIDREDKEDKKKTDNLESFERLRDQLANAYNQAEIERIKAEYELRKRLQEDIYDMQEFGANRLQKQNLQFLRALAKAEQDRQDTLMDAQLKVAEAAGRIAPSAPMLPSAGGVGAGSLPGSISGRLDASGQNGADMPVALNNIMRSYHNGIVTEINRAGNNGNYVVVEFLDDLGNKLEATYSHVAAAVKVGQSIVGGQTIGRFDASGRTFGAHNSVDINTPGTNGALQRNQEGAAARRSADILVTGRVQGSVGAGAPRRIGSNESRDTMAGASVEIAQQNAAISERGGLLTKESTILKELGRYMQEVYNVPDLTLDNQLLKARNDLLEQGVDENVINYKMRLLELDIQYEHLLKAFPKFADAANLKEEDRIKILAVLAQYLGKSKDAEKAKNDETLRGIEIEKTRERDKYIKSLQDEIKLLLIIGDEERRLAEIKAQYGDAKAQEIFNLEKIKKNIEDTRALIDGFVSSTTSDYKGFLKAVISGEDAADALKQFQEGLTDRVLTIFLDFAMAPVEKFMKEAFEGLFLPKAKNIPGLDIKEQTTKNPVEATNINTTATNANTAALEKVAGALASAGGSYSGLSEATINQGFGRIGGASFGGMQLPGLDKVLENIDFETAFEPLQKDFGATLENLSSTLDTNAYSLSQSAVDYSANFKNVGDSAKKMAEDAGKAAEEAGRNGKDWQESLGKVASGIGIAAGAIMGIAAGISQIKEGGTGNTLMGIGSILAGIGGGIGGFLKLGEAANGAVWKGGFQAFANGGMVSGPTLGLIGEGKYNEAIVPLPDGRSIPVQMKGAGGGLREVMGRNDGKASGSPILNMSFQSTNINGVEYVSRDQLEAAMAQTRRDASNDGAKRGMSMTLDKLQQSPSTRRKVGI